MPRPPNPHPYKKTVTRWRDASSKEVKRGTLGAVKSTEKSSTYYADVGGKCVALKTTDLGVAWKRLRELLREEHERELGVRDRYSDHAKTPLEQHLGAWLKVLEAKGTGVGQRETIERRLTKWFAAAQWTRLKEISAERAILTLAKLTKGDSEELLSAQTRNHYITHLRGFCGWLVLTGRLPANPVRELQKGNVEADRRRLRREPTREEIAELFRYLEAAPVLRGMTGPQRAIGYKVAMATGYRAGELGALAPPSFDLTAQVVALPASEDKRRKGDVHPLPDWLVAELRQWFAKGGECWSAFAGWHPGRVLKIDLRQARAAWIAAATDKAEAKRRRQSAFLAYRADSPDGPLFLDMHSLRVFYISELAGIPGMDMKTLMTLARHSTPQLSLSVYAKKREANVRAATDQLKPPTE
jgi:integrase